MIRLTSARARSDHSKTTSGRPSATAIRSPSTASCRPCPTTPLCRSRLPNDDCQACSSDEAGTQLGERVGRAGPGPARGRPHLAVQEPRADRGGVPEPHPAAAATAASSRSPRRIRTRHACSCTSAASTWSCSRRSPGSEGVGLLDQPHGPASRRARRPWWRPPRRAAPRPRRRGCAKPPGRLAGHRTGRARVVVEQRPCPDQLDLALEQRQPARAVDPGGVGQLPLPRAQQSRRDQDLAAGRAARWPGRGDRGPSSAAPARRWPAARRPGHRTAGRRSPG